MRLTARFLTASLFLSAAATTAAYATVRCVKPGPSGTGCWANGTVFTDLQPALAASGYGRRDLGRGRDLQADQRHGPHQELR